MKRKLRLLDLGKVEWHKTQTVYHAAAASLSESDHDTLILCQPDSSYLCLGYHQNFDDVFDRRRVDASGFPVIRRQIGGGATYLDENQFFYQFVSSKKRVPAAFADIFRYFLKVPVSVLHRLGLNAELRKTNEIEVEGRRIAGTGGGFIENSCIVVGNFLNDFDYDTMSDVWSCPSESFRSLASLALKENVRTLGSYLLTPAYDELKRLFVEETEKTFDVTVERAFPDDELLSQAELLRAELTGTTAVNEKSRNRQKVLKISANAFVHYDSIAVGGEEVWGSFYVKKGTIEKVIFDEDGLPIDPDALVGVRFMNWKDESSIVDLTR